MDERIAELREDLYTLIQRSKRPKDAFRTSFDDEHNAIGKRTFKGTADSLRPDLLDEAVAKNVYFQLTPKGFVYYFPGILLRILEIFEAEDEEKVRIYTFPLEQLLFEKQPWRALDAAHRLIARDIWDLGERLMPDAFERYSR